MNKMSFKDSVVTAKQFSAVDMTTGKTIWFSRSRSPQHLYPLTEKDYCEAVKYAVQHGIDQMPILSVSAKDFPYCDFDCKDCLACPSRRWAIEDQHIKYPIIPIDKYKNILREISAYSSRRGFNKVRFEVCGEGNPDLYKHRIEMLEYANQECNMGLVYVSTGSHISDELLECLVNNVAFIRISFPGIGADAYKTYSNQKSKNKDFSYDDAIRMLTENRDILDHISGYLYNRETITGKEFMQIFRRMKGIPEPEELTAEEKEKQVEEGTSIGEETKVPDSDAFRAGLEEGEASKGTEAEEEERKAEMYRFGAQAPTQNQAKPQDQTPVESSAPVQPEVPVQNQDAVQEDAEQNSDQQ